MTDTLDSRRGPGVDRSASDARSRAHLVSLVLAGCVAVLAIARIAPDGASSEPTSRRAVTALACPLTPTQENKAIAAFEKMMPVLTHPRCFNCHGGVNPSSPNHLGGEIDDPNDCKDCHNGLPILNRPGRDAPWDTPPSDFFFVGKSSRDLCNQFKRIEASPSRFVGHMVNENGGPQFTEAAYRGDRGLNAFGRDIVKEAIGYVPRPEPPGMPHSELITHAQEWANTVGTPGWTIPDCGCRLSGSAWEGTVTTSWTLREPAFGTLTETMHATARFEIDSSFRGRRSAGRHWKTTSGSLKWSVTAKGGVCSTSASGTVPITLGGDGNPWGSMRLDPDSAGGTGYSVTIGPWPDAYRPRYNFTCTKEAEAPTLPGIPYTFHSWWNHADGTKVSADGKRITGTLEGPVMQGTVRWVWDFKLVQ